MVTITCGNPYCRGTFSAHYSPAICPYCNGTNTFDVPVYSPSLPPLSLQEYIHLSPNEIYQIEKEYESLSKKKIKTFKSSKKSFKKWLIDSCGWLVKRLKEVGALKVGLITVAAFFGFDISGWFEY